LPGAKIVNQKDAQGTLAWHQIIEDRSSASSSRSLAHLHCIPRPEADKVFEELYDGLMFFVPEERQPRAAQWVMAYIEGKL
jgi:hypothetical protein